MWSTIIWWDVKFKFNLLIVNVEQLLYCNTNLKKIVLHLQYIQQQNKEYINRF